MKTKPTEKPKVKVTEYWNKPEKEGECNHVWKVHCCNGESLITYCNECKVILSEQSTTNMYAN